MLTIYVSFFNLVLQTEQIPKQWSDGIIIPIYKTKGEPKSPNNYKHITLLSWVWKLFITALNNRLNSFLVANTTLLQNQAGFIKIFSTLDHIFTFNSVIELLKHYRKKLHCIFIDFSRAFVSVWRIGLWKKLLSSNVNGIFFRVVISMYNNIKFCVFSRNENKYSDDFICNCGVRQGESLSPILFAVFLNDLVDYLDSRADSGVVLENVDDNIFKFIKI